MRLSIPSLFISLAFVAGCSDPPNRLTGLGPGIPGDTTGIPGDTTDLPGDTTDLPADTMVSAAEAAAFVVEAAGILTGYSDPDDAYTTFQLAGGAGARGAIQPPADSLPEPVCQNPRDPYFYAREQRGLTYVWDPALHSYMYSTEPGASPCAIRLTRYALAAGVPAEPLERVGFIEVYDMFSPTPASGIRFDVVSDTGAAADTVTSYLSVKTYQYYTRAYVENWTLSGFFDRGGDRLVFSFAQRTSSGTISNMDYHDVSGSSVFSGGGVEVTSARDPAAYTLSVRRGGRSVEFRMVKPDSVFELRGAIRTIGPWGYEGVVGTITGSPDAPTFRDNLGGALPPEVESQLKSFWASLIGQFGLHRWPHV